MDAHELALFLNAVATDLTARLHTEDPLDQTPAEAVGHDRAMTAGAGAGPSLQGEPVPVMVGSVLWAATPVLVEEKSVRAISEAAAAVAAGAEVSTALRDAGVVTQTAAMVLAEGDRWPAPEEELVAAARMAAAGIAGVARRVAELYAEEAGVELSPLRPVDNVTARARVGRAAATVTGSLQARPVTAAVGAAAVTVGLVALSGVWRRILPRF